MSRRKATANAFSVAEMAFLAPWVAAARMAKFADTSPAHRRRNAREATRMVSEKGFAFLEAWTSASTALLKANMNLFSTTSPQPLAAVTAAAIKPYRRRVAANARRLAKSRR